MAHMSYAFEYALVLTESTFKNPFKMHSEMSCNFSFCPGKCPGIFMLKIRGYLRFDPYLYLSSIPFFFI